MAEPFFVALKNQRVSRATYPTREHARRDITPCVEFWYNTKRIHSGLDDNTPEEALNVWTNQQIRA